MWALAQAGVRATDCRATDLPSSTDPGFCSLLTGCHPPRPGVRTPSWRYAKLPDWVGSETPRVPTIFDACRRSGIGSAAIVGDDRGLLATGAADYRWPSDGVVPPGSALDAHGYPANSEILPRVLQALDNDDYGLVFAHFNESDTVGHDHGPESDAARDCYIATDRVIGQVLNAVRRRWADTIVVIVSDHDMQPRDTSTPHRVTLRPAFTGHRQQRGRSQWWVEGIQPFGSWQMPSGRNDRILRIGPRRLHR